MVSSRVFSRFLLLALIGSLAQARQLKQASDGCFYGNSNTPLYCNSPPAAPSPPSPTASPPPSPTATPPPSPTASPPPSPTATPPPSPTATPPPSPPSPAASPPPPNSPSPAASPPPASPQNPNCFYGNSSTPLYCNTPPPPTASPPPPAPKNPDCFYGNSSTPLFCNSPPPPSHSPSPPPRKPHCFYGNSSTPLFCDTPPPPSHSPSPAPRKPHCFYGNSSTPLFCTSPSPPPQPTPSPSPKPTPTPSGHHGGSGGGALPVFTTGLGDYKLGSYSRPANASLDQVGISTADDFYVAEAVTIQGFSFEGLLPESMDASTARQYITSVNMLLYEVFPTASNTFRINANDPQQGTDLVVTRIGSPSDTPLFNLSAQIGQMDYTVSSLGPESVTIPLTVTDFNIAAIPNQLQTGNAAPSAFTGKKYEIYVPLKYELQAGAHLFVVPLVGMDCDADSPWTEDVCSFVWASAPYPVTTSNGGTPFPSGVQDAQTWIQGPTITPDWERIGGDIIGNAVAYNAAFTVWA